MYSAESGFPSKPNTNMRSERNLLAVVSAAFLMWFCETSVADEVSDNPILFVTAVPNPDDFGTFAAAFANHQTDPSAAFRGGDLWIRFPDGSLKNLTSEAGYGNAGFQGAGAIAVRDPAVYWDGTKAIFSMVVGAPTQQYELGTYRWQLYEITGLGPLDTPAITLVPNQPAEYNNVAPTYGSDDSILFVSDRPRDDSVLHTYPQRDEYESTPINSGLWKLTPGGSLSILDHCPSGNFNPIVDSYGRVVFTRWDHLQRDQQNVGGYWDAFNFESETSNLALNHANEVFPEPRFEGDPDKLANVNRHTINQFFPWMMNQDGTELETLNHIGRQEVGLYTDRSFNDDPNVQEFYGQYPTGVNENDFVIFLHVKELPGTPGTYVGTSCPEFGTHSAGQILTLTGAPGVNAENMAVTYLTHPDTRAPSDTPGSDHSGLYRDPLPLSNGKILVSHTANTQADTNLGTRNAPASRYDFRLKLLDTSGTHAVPGTLATGGISKSVSFYDPDESVSYSGELWEMMAVEVRSRTRPAEPETPLPAIEQDIFNDAGVDLAEFREYLRQQNLALIVGRNLTARDKNDLQQPTNLRVTGTGTESLPRAGKVYNISWLQIFQGDLIRGYDDHSGGRRVIAQPMHSVGTGINPHSGGAPSGAVKIAEDGSMAAFVPASRALTWQTSGPSGDAVVRERYWVTFQPGEVRVCSSCHGVNTADHLGNPAPTNPPLALARLLAHWKTGGSANARIDVRGIPKNKAGGRFALRVLEASAADSLEVRVAVNGRRPLATRSIGTRQNLRGRFPRVHGVKLTFSLYREGTHTMLDSDQERIRGKKRRMNVRERKRIAKKVARSLR